MSRSLAVGAAAVVLVAGAAVAGAAAQQPSSAPAPAPAAQAPVTDAALAAMVTADEDTLPGTVRATTTPRKTLCARVPTAITRTQALQKRLAADAGTQGSLAWLKAKVDAAEAAERTEAAQALRNRLAFRTELAQFLPHRLEFLQTAQRTVCAPAAAAPRTS